MLATPQTLVSHYFQFSRRIVADATSQQFDSERCTNVAVAVIMVVGAVEAYLNAVARLRVEQNPSYEHDNQIRADLENRTPLRRKLKSWPEMLFGGKLDLGSGVPQEFLELVELRNHLMHFTTTYDQVQVDNLTIKGLTDLTRFYSLTPVDGQNAVNVAEQMILGLIRLQQLSEEEVLLAGTLWTGRPVFPPELEAARARDQQNADDNGPSRAT